MEKGVLEELKHISLYAFKNIPFYKYIAKLYNVTPVGNIVSEPIVINMSSAVCCKCLVIQFRGTKTSMLVKLGL